MSSRNFCQAALPAFASRFSVAIYSILFTVGVFTSGIWGILGIASAIILFGITWWSTAAMPRPNPFQIRLAIFFLIATLILNLWSMNRDASWHTWCNLLTIFIPLSLLSAPQVRAFVKTPQFFTAAPFILGVSAILLGIELHGGGYLLDYLRNSKGHSLNAYNRSFAYVVLIAFPLAAALWHSSHRRWVGPFVLAIIFPALFTESSSAQLALLAGLATVIASCLLPRLTVYGLSALVVSGIGISFLARWGMTNFYEQLATIPASWLHRVEILDYVSYRIADRPLLGWGLGTSHLLSNESPHASHYLHALTAARHPHNMITQLWVELGIFGLAMGLIFQLVTLWRAAALPQTWVPFALGTWAAAFAISLSAFDIWTDSLFAAFALSTFFFIGAMQRSRAGHTETVDTILRN